MGEVEAGMQAAREAAAMKVAKRANRLLFKVMRVYLSGAGF
jgi:hypothetical protein